MGSGKVVVWTNDLCACGGRGEEVGRGLDAPAQSRAGPHVAGSQGELNRAGINQEIDRRTRSN